MLTQATNRKGFFLFAKPAISLLLDSVADSPHPPSLIITGATASLRGSANLASFASGKFALRATGQSLAREFGPKGIHVAHVIVDGVIDIPRTKNYNVNGGVEDSKINPDAVSFLANYNHQDNFANILPTQIADTYWHLHTQPRSHFTQELDTRPYVEKF